MPSGSPVAISVASPVRGAAVAPTPPTMPSPRRGGRLVAKARQTPDNPARYEIYGQLEDKLLGQDGGVPIAPIYWYTYVQLERPTVKDTLNVNLLNQTDYSKVVEVEPSA